MAEISVIIPVYKAEKYLDKCVNSVLEQSFTDFELILVDDGSPDRSGEICDYYASKDSRIKVIHKTNGGVSSARNAGLEVAQGKWAAFVDSDDYVSPKYLEDLHNHATPNALIMQGYTKIHNGEETIVDFGNMVFKAHDIKKVFSDFNFFEINPPWGKIYNLSIIKKNKILFNPQIHCAEDILFTLEYLLHVDKITVVSGANYFYKMDNSSLSIRYNSFESEYLCFKEFKRLSNELAKKYEFILPKEMLRRISLQLMRSILALYITGEHTFFERIKILRQLKKEYGEFFKKNYYQRVIILRILRRLFFCNLVLFDIACVLKFRIRK